MQDLDAHSPTSSCHLAGIADRESDRESSFRFHSLAFDDLPSPRMSPIFGGYNSLIQDLDADCHHEKLAAIGDQFRTLFVGDERDPPSSSSSEEGDESAALEGRGSFCVWSPKRSPAGSESSIGWCRKSRSTGSTATTNWLRLRDLILRRSSSDGKVNLLNSMMKDNQGHKMAAVAAAAAKKKKVSPQEVFYVKAKALREEERRKTFLPYRRGLIGFFH